MAKEMFDKMIEELEKIVTILRSNKKSGKIPDIERDLMLSKLRIIYEFLMLYQPDYVVEKPISLKKEIPIPEPEKINIPEPEKIIIPEPSQKKTEQPEIINIPPEIPVKPLHSPIQPILLAEKFQSKKSFLNEVLTQYTNTYDIAKKFQNSPLNDIFAAIGLNEKFLFIKELFSENAELYKNTIENLNQADSFNDAIEYIDKNFTWDFESSTVHKLLELIRRRHPLTSD